MFVFVLYSLVQTLVHSARSGHSDKAAFNVLAGFECSGETVRSGVVLGGKVDLGRFELTVAHV